MNTPRRIKKVLEALFLAGFFLVLLLIGAELASRYILGEYESEFEEVYQVDRTRTPQPYTMFGAKPSASVSTNDSPLIEHYNRLGYRGPAPTPVKPSGEYRIFILGGSTVFMGSLKWEKGPSIVELLKDIFASHGLSQVKVFNFGVMSAVSGQELARIVYQISDFEPDLVIMYNGGNDILVPISYDPRPGYPFNFMAYEANPLMQRDLKDYPFMAMALLGTNLGRHFLRWYLVGQILDVPRLRRESGFRTFQWEWEIAKSYVVNLIRGNKISQVFGAEFVAYFQPMPHFKEPIIGFLEAHHDRGMSKTVIRFRENVRSLAGEAMASKDLNFTDLSDLFDGIEEEVFIDEIHPKHKNMPMIADAIFSDLEDRGIVATIEAQANKNPK